MKLKEIFNWFKTKQATSAIAIISLLGGIFFIDKKITGNVILNSNYSINLVSGIGLLLIACSVILGIYSLKKRNN